MQTQAHFDDIQLHIIHELNKAKTSIIIAVAWFTDYEIFDLLCDRAEAGVAVELIITNDAINEKSGLDRERLRTLGGSINLIGGKKSNGRAIMHNKFCVIDAVTVITGSYNWSRQAQQNDENITIISEAPELSEQFISEFFSLKNRQGIKNSAGDPGKILSRIEALKHIINLDDEDDISLQVRKLKRLIPDGDSYSDERCIIAKIEVEEYEEATTLIDKYTRTRKQVTVYVAPEISEVRLELSALELQVAAMEDEKAEMERALHVYRFRHAIELGEIIRRLLSIRTERTKQEAQASPEKEQEYQEAKKDYEEFTQDYEHARQNEVADLAPEEQMELKALFRASSKFCHPDLVSEDQKAEAARMFHRLLESNERNDLAAVREIYENLRKGIFNTASNTLNDAQRLHQEVVRMRTRVSELARSARTIRSSEAYRKVTRITDWDEYFRTTRQKLEEELAQLEIL